VPAYVFHVFQTGGAALSFEVRVLASDHEAVAHAEQVLQEHRSAAETEIWDDARLVHKAVRTPDGPTHAPETGPPDQ
jgi:hypothetical protein